MGSVLALAGLLLALPAVAPSLEPAPEQPQDLFVAPHQPVKLDCKIPPQLAPTEGRFFYWGFQRVTGADKPRMLCYESKCMADGSLGIQLQHEAHSGTYDLLIHNATYEAHNGLYYCDYQNQPTNQSVDRRFRLTVLSKYEHSLLLLLFRPPRLLLRFRLRFRFRAQSSSESSSSASEDCGLAAAWRLALAARAGCSLVAVAGAGELVVLLAAAGCCLSDCREGCLPGRVLLAGCITNHLLLNAGSACDATACDCDEFCCCRSLASKPCAAVSKPELCT